MQDSSEGVRCDLCGQVHVLDVVKADVSRLVGIIGERIIKAMRLTHWHFTAGIYFKDGVHEVMEFTGCYQDCFWLLRSTYERDKGELLTHLGRQLGYYVAWKEPDGVHVNTWHRDLPEFMMTGLFPNDYEIPNTLKFTPSLTWRQEDFNIREILFGKRL